ncbi:MAG TPA: formamidopyrimidine-DNA glycosylase, partial [Acidimicrobiaceae bacterium]|nr:formamidopyrimidine-DNA glycosylase [Acidimicrobiaceae bacterium]
MDETLWRAGIDPARTCDEVAPAEVPVLAEAIRTTVAELTRRGGSHTGDLQAG